MCFENLPFSFHGRAKIFCQLEVYFLFAKLPQFILSLNTVRFFQSCCGCFSYKDLCFFHQNLCFTTTRSFSWPFRNETHLTLNSLAYWTRVNLKCFPKGIKMESMITSLAFLFYILSTLFDMVFLKKTAFTKFSQPNFCILLFDRFRFQ